MGETDPEGGHSRWRGIALPLVLLFSALLRILLALLGGENFFPDEQRYTRSRKLLEALWVGDWHSAISGVLGAPDHTGFVVLGLIPAAVQHLFQGPHTSARLWIGACVLSLGGVAVVALTAKAARLAGAGPDESLVAACLVAGSTSMNYFARHLVPYDLSLALGLGALCVGLSRPTSNARSVACGALAGLALLTYNGSLALALVVCAAHVLFGPASILERARRAFLALLGGLSWFVALEGASRALGGSYLQGMAAFSRTISQCEFSEGWSAPFGYLWSAEHGLALLWLAGLAVAAGALAREKQKSARGLLWLGSVAALYLIFVLFSAALHKFCVYGRIARQLVPFLCLATAFALQFLPARFRSVERLGAVALVLQVGWNLWQPFVQSFPREVSLSVVTEYERVGYDTTLEGPYAARRPGHRWMLLNSRYLAPVWGVREPPAGRVVFRTPHPLEWIPYQYESLSSRERAILRSTDISIRLIDTRPAGEVPDEREPLH